VKIKIGDNLKMQDMYIAFHGNPSVRSAAISECVVLRLDVPLCYRIMVM